MQTVEKIAELFSQEELLSLLAVINDAFSKMEYGTDLKLSLELAVLNYFRKTF
jgi:hypothetical protein